MTELSPVGSQGAGDEHPSWIDDYLAGASLRSIAKTIGVSHEQVRILLDQHGVPRRSRTQFLEERKARDLEVYGGDVRLNFFETLDVQQTAERVGVTPWTVRLCLDAQVQDWKVLTRASRDPRKKYTSAELLENLREAAKRTGGVLAVNRYEQFIAGSPTMGDGRVRPGKHTIMVRFGSWNVALQAAGLPTNPKAGPPKSFDDPAVALRAILQCWQELKSPPTSTQYSAWQKGKDYAPSLSIASRLLGSWSSGVIRAWQVVHGITLDQDDAELAVPSAEVPLGRRECGSPREPLPVQEPGGFKDYVPADEGGLLSTHVDWTVNDLQQRERSVQSHARIQNAIARELLSRGVLPLSSEGSSATQCDLAFFRKGDSETLFVVEVKSTTPLNSEAQMRLGLGQVLRYAHQLRAIYPRVEATLATELAPSREWHDLMASVGVHSVHEGALSHGIDALLRLQIV